MGKKHGGIRAPHLPFPTWESGDCPLLPPVIDFGQYGCQRVQLVLIHLGSENPPPTAGPRSFVRQEIRHALVLTCGLRSALKGIGVFTACLGREAFESHCTVGCRVGARRNRATTALEVCPSAVELVCVGSAVLPPAVRVDRLDIGGSRVVQSRRSRSSLLLSAPAPPLPAAIA